MSATNYLFTSESVTEGHPDKIADKISDSILDSIMAEDKQCRVACETMVTTGMAIISGEITTSTWVDMPQIVRETIKEIGYNNSGMGFDWETCAVMTSIDKQSPDISQGVTAGEGLFEEQGAGDQGLMFGLCLQRNPGSYAHAHLLCPPYHEAFGASPEEVGRWTFSAPTASRKLRWNTKTVLPEEFTPWWWQPSIYPR